MVKAWCTGASASLERVQRVWHSEKVNVKIKFVLKNDESNIRNSPFSTFFMVISSHYDLKMTLVYPGFRGSWSPYRIG